MSDELRCCFIPDEDVEHFEKATSAADVDPERGCQNPAEYEVIDTADKYFPERGVTHACADHVGHLLGHATDGNWAEGDPELWEIRPVEGTE